MIFVFDLDDTLYTELDYVKEALKNVSKYLAEIFSEDPLVIHGSLLKLLKEEGRANLFDRYLKKKKFLIRG